MRRAKVSTPSTLLQTALLMLTGAAFLWLAPVAFAEESGEHEPAAGEHEAGAGEHHGIDGKTLALQVVNFAVLLFILIRFGGRALNGALKKRHEELKAALEESVRLRTAAEARLAEQEKRLTNLATEIGELRARMKQEAEAEKARLVAAAEDKSARVRKETEFLLAQQVRQAELGFQAEVAAAAARIAAELVRSSVGPEDQRRLVESFVGDIDDGEKAGAN